MLFYVNSADIPEAFQAEPVQAVSTIDTAEALGITSDSEASWATRLMHYQLSEIFRINDGITLYVGVIENPRRTPLQSWRRCRTMPTEPFAR